MVAKRNKNQAKPSVGRDGGSGRKRVDNESYVPLPPLPGSKVIRGKEKKRAQKEEEEEDDAIFDLDIDSEDENGDNSDKGDYSEEEMEGEEVKFCTISTRLISSFAHEDDDKYWI